MTARSAGKPRKGVSWEPDHGEIPGPFQNKPGSSTSDQGSVEKSVSATLLETVAKHTLPVILSFYGIWCLPLHCGVQLCVADLGKALAVFLYRIPSYILRQDFPPQHEAHRFSHVV